MKRVLWKRSKRYLMMLLGLVLLAAGAAGVVLSQKPTSEESERTLYSYTVTADSDYRVKIMENELYDTTWLEAGKAYPGALTSEIEMTFLTDFIGSEAADVKGSYDIKAVIEIFYNGTNGRSVLIREEYPMKKGSIRGSGNRRVEKNDTITLNPEVYRNYIANAELVMATNISSEMTVEFSGELLINTPYGEREETFSYIRVMPIVKGTEIYEIATKEPLIQEKSITEMETIEVEANELVALPFALLGASGVILFLFILIGTRSAKKAEVAAVESQQILKKYASRMISLISQPDLGTKPEIYLESVDKLLLLSEELQKPVFYSVDEKGIVADGRFYIVDREFIYVFRTEAVEPAEIVAANEEAGAELEANLEPVAEPATEPETELMDDSDAETDSESTTKEV